METTGSDITRLASDFMEQGDNCCEAVVKAANAVWKLDLPREVMAAASLFREGMDSGCTCGALVGMVMLSGILRSRWEHPRGEKLAAHLTARFRLEFGSTCCRVICKQRPLWARIGKKGCIALTGKTAGILEEVWADARNDRGQDFCDYPHAQ